MSFPQTLVAFVVGGAVTLAGQLIPEALREKRACGHREDERKTEAKMAARLVVLDLSSILALVRGARQTGHWWSALLLPLGAGEAYRQALSRELDDEAWRMVGATFAGAAAWNELVRGTRRYYWLMPHMKPAAPGPGGHAGRAADRGSRRDRAPARDRAAERGGRRSAPRVGRARAGRSLMESRGAGPPDPPEDGVATPDLAKLG